MGESMGWWPAAGWSDGAAAPREGSTKRRAMQGEACATTYKKRRDHEWVDGSGRDERSRMRDET